MWLTLVVLLVGTPVVVAAVVWFAVHAVRWAKKNRARAAAMMTGSFLDDVEGGEIDTNDDGTVSRFIDWLGAKVDAISDGPAAVHEAEHGSDAATYDGGHSSADSCSGGDSGGVCGD